MYMDDKPKMAKNEKKIGNLNTGSEDISKVGNHCRG